MTTISYCDHWNDMLKGPIDPLSEAEARARHEGSGKYYTAVVGDLEHPEALMMVSLEGEMVSVDFFDAETRPYLGYQFDVRDGRLFLSHASITEYREGEAVRSYEHYRFEPDGHLWRSREEQGVRDTWEQWADVAGNWEDMPPFGDYAGVLRLERDTKPLDGPPSQIDTPA